MIPFSLMVAPRSKVKRKRSRIQYRPLQCCFPWGILVLCFFVDFRKTVGGFARTFEIQGREGKELPRSYFVASKEPVAKGS